MTRLVAVTVGLGGVVERRWVHDTAGWPPESVAMLEVVRPIVRVAEWTGPLEGVLDVPRPLPWVSWRREGPDASLVCQTSEGLPVTYSVVVSGRGGADRGLLEGLAGLPVGRELLTAQPEAGAPLLGDVVERPLLASRVSGWPAPAELVETCGQVETLLGVAFCEVVGGMTKGRPATR